MFMTEEFRYNDRSAVFTITGDILPKPYHRRDSICIFRLPQTLLVTINNDRIVVFVSFSGLSIAVEYCERRRASWTTGMSKTIQERDLELHIEQQGCA